MSNPLVAATVRRLAARRDRTPADAPAVATDDAEAAARVTRSEQGLRLAGDPTPLSRISVVRPGTSVLVFAPGAKPRLLAEGDVLTPTLRLSRAPTYLVVTHQRFSVDLTLGPMNTLDGSRIDGAQLRLVLRLDLSDRGSGLLGLAEEHGTDLERELLERIRGQVTSDVVAAVRMNRLADLAHRSLTRVLDDRWLGRTFVDRRVLRESFEVLNVDWPTEVSGRPGATAATPARAG